MVGMGLPDTEEVGYNKKMFQVTILEQRFRILPSLSFALSTPNTLNAALLSNSILTPGSITS